MNSTTVINGPVSGATNAAPTPADRLHLRLPATSANLGPGFDTLAVALTLALEIDATPSPEFQLHATGRNSDICSSLRRNLMLDAYQRTLAAHDTEIIPLAIEIRNQIPIGMGLGSSAAVRLAAVALANHFGKLGWDREKILIEASRLEGHPDNVAACWLGGFTVATMTTGHVHALSLPGPASWRVVLAMPDKPVATTAARLVLPRSYDQSDVVFNIQHTSLMTAAIASGRGDLLQFAMQDRLHQPFRGEICPLLPRLLPLAGKDGILGVALSGAGPSVLLLIEKDSPMQRIRDLIADRVDSTCPIEVIECEVEPSPALMVGATLKT